QATAASGPLTVTTSAATTIPAGTRWQRADGVVYSLADAIVIDHDNTWAAGVLFKALEFDIDISIQAGTKYLIGHSDAMVGTAVAN
ncbi:PLP-dependent transferase, partial [Salmonella enterica subsp. enterica serovar Montevideo]|nr:PLP-dependent transferase [Salmonella enterica subsp. enterica serovar Montevideo]